MYKMKSFIKSFLILGLITSFGVFSYAQTVDKAQLEIELKQLESEMEAHKKSIQDKQKEAKSYQRDIGILDTKIKKTETEIKLRNKNIQNISYNIQDKNKKIETLGEKIIREKKVMLDVLRSIDSQPKMSLILSVLSDKSISSSVDNLYNINNLKASLVSSVESIRKNKNVLEGVKSELEDTKEEEESLKSRQVVQKIEIEDTKTEKKTILKETKGQEKAYQELLKNTEKRAKDIRAALFSFKDGTQVNFGNLYDYARRAGSATGIRPEFILAILEQESAFGSNVGQCYVSDSAGALVTIASGKARGSMKPDSLKPFLDITASLGRDQFKTRVSCSLSYGYGGAMGMSQFMPATWIGYKDRIQAAIGVPVADPWNASHAITGTAYLLKDNKAGSQSYTDERNAACRYYSGSSCIKSSNAANYGNQVMARIAGIQEKIEVLKNN